jgi:hypothetical protein
MKFPKRPLTTFKLQNSGYTIIEVLSAMQLTLLIIGLACSGYLFSQTLFNRWQEKIRIEEQLAILSKTISIQLWRTREILEAKETEMLLIKFSGDSLRLRLDNGVYLNQDSLILRPIKIRAGKFSYFLRSDRSDQIRQSDEPLNLSDLSKIAAVQVDLSLYRRNQEYPLRVFCRLPRIQAMCNSNALD